MKIKSTVSLNIDGDRLVYAGRGYQASADFPQGKEVGELVAPSSDKICQVKICDELYFVNHENIMEI